MNIKSAVLRVVYHADNHSVYTDTRINSLMYLVTDSTDIECPFEEREYTHGIGLESSEVESAIDELEGHRLIETRVKRTQGGEKRTTYKLTDKGVSKAELLVGNSDTEDTIESVVSKYGDYPISNLLNEMKESEDGWV